MRHSRSAPQPTRLGHSPLSWTVSAERNYICCARGVKGCRDLLPLPTAAAIGGACRAESRCSPLNCNCHAGREDVRLLSVAVDGRLLGVGEYERAPALLTLPPAVLPPAAARVGAPFEVATRVALCPRANTELQVHHLFDCQCLPAWLAFWVRL